MSTVTKEPDPALALFSVEELLDEVMRRRIVSCLISVELDQATDDECRRGHTNLVTHILGDWEDLNAHNENLSAEVKEYLDEQLESEDD